MQDNAAKRYLWEYRAIEKQIQSLLRTRDRLARDVGRYDAAYERATRATSRLRAVAISGTGLHDGMANAVLDMIRYRDAAGKCSRISGYDELIATRIIRLTDALAARLALIDRLTDERYKALLVLRYVEGRDWRDIARGMGYEERQVYRLHGAALEELRAAREGL